MTGGGNPPSGSRPPPGMPPRPGGSSATASTAERTPTTRTAPAPGPSPAPAAESKEVVDPRVARLLPVDFCRKNLAYRPGRLECAQVGENVCWVLLGAQWTLTRTPMSQYVIPCPDGPAPPVCPRMTFR